MSETSKNKSIKIFEDRQSKTMKSSFFFFWEGNEISLSMRKQQGRETARNRVHIGQEQSILRDSISSMQNGIRSSKTGENHPSIHD